MCSLNSIVCGNDRTSEFTGARFAVERIVDGRRLGLQNGASARCRSGPLNLHYIASPHTILCPSGVLRPNSLRPHGLFVGSDETSAPLPTKSR
jgi:hypothetical protein